MEIFYYYVLFRELVLTGFGRDSYVSNVGNSNVNTPSRRILPLIRSKLHALVKLINKLLNKTPSIRFAPFTSHTSMLFYGKRQWTNSRHHDVSPP